MLHRSPHHTPRPRLLPFPKYLLLGGHGLILLAAAEFVLRLRQGTSHDHFLYAEDFVGSVAAALIFLWLSALGLDLLYRHGGQSRRP
jgi:hypothetical protein